MRSPYFNGYDEKIGGSTNESYLIFSKYKHKSLYIFCKDIFLCKNHP